MTDNSKYMFLITGTPGSGKSTLAQKLQHNSPKFINPIDSICEADQYFYIVGKGEYAFNPKLLWKAHAWCQSKVKDQMIAGNNVIVSNTNIRPRDRKPYFDMAKTYGYNVVYIHLTTQFKNVHSVPTAVVERMRDNYVELTSSEQDMVLDAEDMSDELCSLLATCGI